MDYNIIGAWLIVLVTLSIFSYLYGDNPFYKSAEHIFVGISAGYIFALTFWDTIWPLLFGRLFPNIVNAGYELDLLYIIPFILGIFMLLRLVPKLSWLARISIAYIVGMMAGLKLYVYINSNILEQIQNSGIDFTSGFGNIINQVIILVGVICALVYFFFSKEHKGTIGIISKIGIFFLMIKFGASFGYTVMGRISLLIGRFEELIEFGTSDYYYATPLIFMFMVITLALWSASKPKENKNNEIK